MGTGHDLATSLEPGGPSQEWTLPAPASPDRPLPASLPLLDPGVSSYPHPHAFQLRPHLLPGAVLTSPSPSQWAPQAALPLPWCPPPWDCELLCPCPQH